jgi:hypothetical protein
VIPPDAEEGKGRKNEREKEMTMDEGLVIARLVFGLLMSWTALALGIVGGVANLAIPRQAPAVAAV